MIRKHIKVEPRRYYYHCDRLGMMIWQDQVSGGQGAAVDPPEARSGGRRVAGRGPRAVHARTGAHDRHAREPSVASSVWVPFNESWGQHRTVEVGQWTAKRDPTRLVNIASGGNFWPVGDIVDAHKYPHPGFPFDEARPDASTTSSRSWASSAATGIPVQGHLWDANRRNWGYGGLPKNKDEYSERYETSLDDAQRACAARASPPASTPRPPTSKARSTA